MPENNETEISRHGQSLFAALHRKYIGPVPYDGIRARLFSNSRLSTGYFFMLIASCMIALLGLLMNSSAVIIGAMLISPLMDPILGTALALATVDKKENLRSLKGMAISVAFVGLFVLVFMQISPLKEATPEILARTRPNLFDLFVALFAAMAGTFVLVTGQGGNTIPGVAIATALMPPLVTAFWGVSTGNMGMARGAGYLFVTNLATITFAAMLIFWLLGFRPELTQKTLFKRVVSYQVLVFSAMLLALAFPLTRTLVLVAGETNTSLTARRAVRATIQDQNPNMRLAHLETATQKGRLNILVAVETPSYIKPGTVRQWEKEIGLQMNMPVTLQVRQIAVMETDPLAAFAALAPKQSVAAPAAPPPVSGAQAIAEVRLRFDQAGQELMEAMKFGDQGCRDMRFSLGPQGPVTAECLTRRPLSISDAQKKSMEKMLEKIFEEPVSLTFTAEEKEWLALSIPFLLSDSSGDPASLPCDALAAPRGLRPEFAILPVHDGTLPQLALEAAAAPRLQKVRNLLLLCGARPDAIKISAPRYRPEAFAALRETGADAEDALRAESDFIVEVWIGAQDAE
jgi:uncharacterized hydrophobic protein (TIGR00271 family)